MENLVTQYQELRKSLYSQVKNLLVESKFKSSHSDMKCLPISMRIYTEIFMLDDEIRVRAEYGNNIFESHALSLEELVGVISNYNPKEAERHYPRKFLIRGTTDNPLPCYIYICEKQGQVRMYFQDFLELAKDTMTNLNLKGDASFFAGKILQDIEKGSPAEFVASKENYILKHPGPLGLERASLEHYYREIEVFDGERVYTCKGVFRLPETSEQTCEEYLDELARTFYEDSSHKEGDSWWHFGEVLVKAKYVVQITKEEYEVLSKFI